MQTVHLYKKHIGSGTLILVNESHPMRGSTDISLMPVDMDYKDVCMVLLLHYGGGKNE